MRDAVAALRHAVADDDVGDRDLPGTAVEKVRALRDRRLRQLIGQRVRVRYRTGGRLHDAVGVLMAVHRT